MRILLISAFAPVPGHDKGIRNLLDGKSIDLVSISPENSVSTDFSSFDAVICDESVPCGDGLEILRHLRSSGLYVPFFFLVDGGTDGFAADALNAGADGYYDLSIGRERAIGMVSGGVFGAVEKYHSYAALRQNENYFQLLFENAPIGYQSLDGDGRFIEVNGAWLAATGYNKEHIIGRWFGDVLTRDCVDDFRTLFPRFKEIGYIKGVEFTIMKKDGSTLPVYFDGIIGHNERGEFLQTHCIMHDITTLRQTQERLNTFMSSAQEGFAIIGSDLQIVDCNDAIASIVGERREVVLGRGLMDMFPSNREHMRRYYDQMMETGVPVFTTMVLQHHIVGVIRADIKAFKVGNDVAVIVNFISPPRMDERTSTDQSSFAHMVSHDIRGPLAVIQGYADLLQDECDSPYLHKIQEKSREIASYILQSVELADATAPPSTHASIDIGVFVLDIIREHLPSVPVTVRAGDKIRGDPKRIKLVFANLLSNIAAHAKASSASIVTHREGGVTRVTVSDDGVGIADEYIHKIFERGFSTSKGSKGLGLTITKKTVEAHGGSISVSSPSGQGTVFEILFPQ